MTKGEFFTLFLEGFCEVCNAVNDAHQATRTLDQYIGSTYPSTRAAKAVLEEAGFKVINNYVYDGPRCAKLTLNDSWDYKLVKVN